MPSFGAAFRVEEGAGVTKYYHVEDGEWIRITKKDHQHRCCDCAMVHTVSYRSGPNGSLETRWKLNARATSAARRKFKFTPEED